MIGLPQMGCELKQPFRVAIDSAIKPSIFFLEELEGFSYGGVLRNSMKDKPGLYLVNSQGWLNSYTYKTTVRQKRISKKIFFLK